MIRFFRKLMVALIVLALVAATAPLWAMVLHGICAHPRPADAIVVPGAALWNGGRDLSDALRYRMDTAVELYRAGYAPKIILSGGGEGRWNEPMAMARYAMSAGVPKSALILDHQGMTTRDTARNVAHILGADRVEAQADPEGQVPDLSKISGRRPFGLGDTVVDWCSGVLDRATADKPTVLVVTQWCHVPRMRVAMQHEGLRAYGSPCSHPRFLRNEAYMVLREAVGLWAYSLKSEDSVRDWLGSEG